MGNEISEEILVVDRDERLTVEMTYEQAKAKLIEVLEKITNRFKDRPEGQKLQENKDCCMQELQKLEDDQDDQKKFLYVLQGLDTILSQVGNPSPFDVECCLGKNENGQLVFLSKNISDSAKKYSKTIVVTQEELVRIHNIYPDRIFESKNAETNEEIFQTIVVPKEAEIISCTFSKTNVPTPYEWINPESQKPKMEYIGGIDGNGQLHINPDAPPNEQSLEIMNQIHGAYVETFHKTTSENEGS